MQIFSPDLVGAVAHKETGGAPEAPVIMHSHDNMTVLAQFTIDEQGNLLFKGAHVGGSLSNADVLARFSVVDNVLQFDGEPVDTVGQQFVNAAILSKFSVLEGKLLFDGTPVDTVGSVFSNDAVLRMFSQDQDGNLLFNGQDIKGGGTDLPNAADLERLAIDENGQLTVDGTAVGGGSDIQLSVTKLGTGVALVKGFSGSDLQTKSIVAGANMSIDVTGDELKFNASLSGSTSAAATFTKADDYSRASDLISLSYATKLRANEPALTDSGLLFQATLCDDTKASMTGVQLSGKNTVPALAETPLFRNERALKCAGGCLVVPEGTTASATPPSAWFSGTKDWCIEFEFARDTTKLGVTQNLVSNFTDSYANASMWIGIGTDNCPYLGIGYGATVSQSVSILSAAAITDGNKHHIAVSRSGSTYTLFVDGVVRGTATSSASNNAPTGGLYLGASVTAGAAQTVFYGWLRNLRVWNFAKYTAAFTVPSITYPTTGPVLDMSGKLLSASFWKQVASLAVTSTETATAYLKWLMVDAQGTWKWDAANSVWVSATTDNILTEGMTTTQLIAAMLNNQWNYRSDVIGFAVAFVSDGATAPVLTDLTINAVQSADKTAGHSVLDAQGTALPQRTKMQFKGMSVSDDGEATVITGNAAEVAQLQTDVAALNTKVGKVDGYAVDVSSPQNGSVLAYDSAKNSFVAALPAIGASGNGLHMTDVVTLAAGAEALVTHQQVVQGRAVYQAEEFIAAGSATSKRDTGFNAGLVSAAPIGSQSLRAQRPGFRLPFQYTSIAKLAAKTMPAAVAYAEVFQVDDNVYLFGGRTSSTTATTAVMKATHGSPSTVTKGSETVGAPYTDTYSGTNILRVGDYLYRVCEQTYSGATASTSPAVSRAHISDPLTWTQIGVVSTPIYWSARFIIGDYLYYVGGLIGSTVQSSVYRSKLTDLCTVEYVGTFAGGFLYAATSYQYGDYLYIIGGRGGSSASPSTVLSNKIWRAHISDPLTWTQIGTFPMVTAYSGCAVVGDRVVIGGVRTGSDGNNVSTAVYVSNAADPTSWSATTALSSALIARSTHCVDDMVLFYGGATFSLTCSTLVESYQLTFTNTADRAVVYTADYSLDPVQSITSLELDANLPAGTSIRTLVSFDKGVTWCYWNGSVWVESLLNDAAFDSTLDAVASGSRFTVPGIAGTFDKETVRFAFQLKSTVATLTPRLYSVNLNYVEAGSMMPLSVGGFNSAMAEIGVKHRQGTYSATSVKNLTQRSLQLVLKVYDGAQ